MTTPSPTSRPFDPRDDERVVALLARLHARAGFVFHRDAFTMRKPLR